jgi:hypothetical protein
MNKLKEETYRLMDSFLVEAKDQYGNERSLEKLNQDRHLFVKNLLQLFKDSVERAMPKKKHNRFVQEVADVYNEAVEQFRKNLKKEME